MSFHSSNENSFSKKWAYNRRIKNIFKQVKRDLKTWNDAMRRWLCISLKDWSQQKKN